MSDGIRVAVLAAGRGSRLGGPLPKPCVPLLGRSVAEWNLRSFAEAGLRRFLVVLGHAAARVRGHYEGVAAALGCDVEFTTAEGWQRGNGVSALAAARRLGEGPYLLSMADHLFSSGLVAAFAAEEPRPGTVHLAVDRRVAPGVDLDDLTKVGLDGEAVIAIGKDLPRWDAGDVGLFHATGGLAEGLEAAQARGGYSLSDGARECAERRRLRAVPIAAGEVWLDLDTPDDLARAAREWRR